MPDSNVAPCFYCVVAAVFARAQKADVRLAAAFGAEFISIPLRYVDVCSATRFTLTSA